MFQRFTEVRLNSKTVWSWNLQTCAIWPTGRACLGNDSRTKFLRFLLNALPRYYGIIPTHLLMEQHLLREKDFTQGRVLWRCVKCKIYKSPLTFFASMKHNQDALSCRRRKFTVVASEIAFQNKISTP